MRPAASAAATPDHDRKAARKEAMAAGPLWRKERVTPARAASAQQRVCAGFTHSRRERHGVFTRLRPTLCAPHRWCLSSPSMTILLIQGPGLAGDPALPPALPTQPHARLELAACDSLDALLHCLASERAQRAELVLLESCELDRAQCACCGPALRQALDALRAPYIELHDRADQGWEDWLRPRHAALAVVAIRDDRRARYAMALAIAQRTCARLAA